MLKLPTTQGYLAASTTIGVVIGNTSIIFQAGEALAMRACWQRQFGDQKTFEVPQTVVTLVGQAAKERSELAVELNYTDIEAGLSKSPASRPRA